MLSKIFKYAIFFISGVAILAIFAFGILHFSSKGVVYNGVIINAKTQDSANYNARLVFERYERLLRSTRIAKVAIKHIEWSNGGEFISDIRNEGWNLYFQSSAPLSTTQNLGSFSYTVSFSPVILQIVKRYILLVGFLSIMWLLWLTFTRIVNVLPPPQVSIRLITQGR